MLSSSQTFRALFLWILFAILVAACLDTGIEAQQVPDEYKAQVREQAAIAAAQPAKVTANLLAPDITVGTQAQIEITAVNMDDQPLTATEDWKYSPARVFVPR